MFQHDNNNKSFIMFACVETNDSIINFVYLILANETSVHVSRIKEERNAANALKLIHIVCIKIRTISFVKQTSLNWVI